MGALFAGGANDDLSGALFCYPMVNSLTLALRDDVLYLDLHRDPDAEAGTVATLAMQTEVEILDRVRTEELLPNGRTRPIFWFRVQAQDVNDATVEGWVNQRDLFVESRTESTQGRIVNGTPIEEWTLTHIERMVNDFRFGDALFNTLLLIIIILPVQFVLAITMALILHSQIKGSTLFLYIYTIPLGISDLAAGLVWYAFFTQRGFINSGLNHLGLQDNPYVFISAENYGWLLTAIVLAEVWRATSIVMVIVVSGLQSIPREYIEAGEVFGASLWQRIWHVILPILRPSLQVALILRTILAFQVFAVVVAITGGDVFTVLANETYRWYDQGDAGFNNPNVAAAYAGFIMIISLGISLFYLRAVRTQEEANR
ncbi:MAG: sugar ABC transporter permease [Anaerolineae bacterium]|nr:sugar ABC transporter permease [Anaerolineae bacterium]